MRLTHWKYYVATVLFLAISGCASNIQHIPTTQAPISKNKVFSGSFDHVWSAAQRVLSEETTFKILDKSSGIMVTELRTIDAKELSLAQTYFLGKTYKSSYTVNFSPAGGGKTDVKVSVKLQAVQVVLLSREESNENVESYLRQQFFDKLAKLLQKGEAKAEPSSPQSPPRAEAPQKSTPVKVRSATDL